MPPNQYLIAGSLPWGGGGGGMFDYMSSSDPAKSLASHYAMAYQSALDMNRVNYGNILKGYQQMALGQMGGQHAVNKGYKNLLDTVMHDIAGQGKSQRQDITDQYAAASGKAMQDLVSSGLGNSTVTSSVNRGLTLDEAKANNQLAEQLAKQQAGFRTSIGTDRLHALQQGFKDRNENMQSQLNWMNSIQAQFPDGGAYGQLAQGIGAADQARENAGQLLGLIKGAQTGFGTYGMGTQSPLYSAGAANYMAGQLASGGAFNSGGGGGGGSGGGGGGQSPFTGGRPGGFSTGYGGYQPGQSKGGPPGQDSYDKGIFGADPYSIASYKGSGGYSGTGEMGYSGFNPSALNGLATLNLDLSGIAGLGGLWGGS